MAVNLHDDMQKSGPRAFLRLLLTVLACVFVALTQRPVGVATGQSALAELADSTESLANRPVWSAEHATAHVRKQSLAPLPLNATTPYPGPWIDANNNFGGWPAGENLCHAADYLFDESRLDYDPTHGLLVIRGGKLVCERYQSQYYSMFHAFTTWSVAKSLVHLLVGVLVRQGRLDIHKPVVHYSPDLWPDPADSRRNISIENLLRMRSGLEWGEVIDDVLMLFGRPQGCRDAGAYAANKPARYPPGIAWDYSTGGTNIVSRVVRDVVGGPTALLRLLDEEVHQPLGMVGLQPGFDASGTFVGSSFLHANLHDLAKIGLLYLRDGVWANGRRILPRGWVDHARTASFLDEHVGYGAHWWLNPKHPSHFFASGTGGQRLYLVPEDDVIIVRLGAGGARSYAPSEGVHLGCGFQCEQPFWFAKLEPLVLTLVERLRTMR